MSLLDIPRNTPELTPKPQTESVLPILVGRDGAPLDGSDNLIIWLGDHTLLSGPRFNNARKAIGGEGVPTRIEDLSNGDRLDLLRTISIILKEGGDYLTSQEKGVCPDLERIDVFETKKSYMLLTNSDEAGMGLLPDQRPSFTTILSAKPGALKITIASDLIDEIASAGDPDRSCAYTGGLEISMHVNGKTVLIQPGGLGEVYDSDGDRIISEIETIIDTERPGFSAFIDRMILVALKTGSIPGTVRQSLSSLPPGSSQEEQLASLARGQGNPDVPDSCAIDRTREDVRTILLDTAGLLGEFGIFMAENGDSILSEASREAITASTLGSIFEELTDLDLSSHRSIADAALKYMMAKESSARLLGGLPAANTEPIKIGDISVVHTEVTETGIIHDFDDLPITFDSFIFVGPDDNYFNLTYQSARTYSPLSSYLNGIPPSIEIGRLGSEPMIVNYDPTDPNKESNKKYLDLMKAIGSLRDLIKVIKEQLD